MKAGITTSIPILLVILISGLQAPASAQGTAGAASQLIVPNARAQGMGRAFTAIAEGPSAAWWNPGALAFPRLLSGSPFSISKLVPDLADDVWFYSVGGAVQFPGIGAGLGGHLSYLTYGESVATNQEGDELGTFRSWEYMLLMGGALDIGRYLFGSENVYWGVGGNVKFFKVRLAPSSINGVPLLDGESGSGTAGDGDLGTLVVVRFPLDVDEPESPAGPSYFGIRGGYTLKNVLDQEIAYIDEDQADPLGRRAIVGLAFEAAYLQFPPFGHAVKGVFSVQSDGFLFKIHEGERAIHSLGAEVSILGIVTPRIGYIYDEDGDIKDFTLGLGLGVDLWDVFTHRFGGRFDIARVPQAEELDHVWHFSFSAWISM